jgi:hypothetical protein
MAELTDESRSGDIGRTGTSERARSTRKNIGNPLVAVLAPRNHRRAAGDEHLRGETAVNAG